MVKFPPCKKVQLQGKGSLCSHFPIAREDERNQDNALQGEFHLASRSILWFLTHERVAKGSFVIFEYSIFPRSERPLFHSSVTEHVTDHSLLTPSTFCLHFRVPTSVQVWLFLLPSRSSPENSDWRCAEPGSFYRCFSHVARQVATEISTDALFSNDDIDCKVPCRSVQIKYLAMWMPCTVGGCKISFGSNDSFLFDIREVRRIREINVYLRWWRL